jgi:hypothetical protein
VTRFYAANLKEGRIGDPGLARLEAIARAIGFRRLSGWGTPRERAEPRTKP